MGTRRLLQLSLVLALICGTGLAQTIVLVPNTPVLNVSGGSLTFNVKLDYDPAPNVLGISVYMPAGWTYVSGANEPSLVKPIEGDTTDSTHPLGWAYDVTPASPATFSFTVAYPANITEGQSLLSQIVLRDSAGSPATIIDGEPVVFVSPLNRILWLGGVGSWTDNTQWSGGTIPTSSGSAVYSAEVKAGAATIPAGSSVTLADLNFSGGSISGSSGTLSLTGFGSVWSGGVFSSLSQLIVGATGQLNVTSAGNHDFDATTISNEGHLVWQDAGPLRSGNGGKLINASSCAFLDTNTSATPAVITNAFGGTFSVSNSGIWVKSGTGTTSIRAPFANTGSLIVDAGTLEFTSSYSQVSGALFIGAGAALNFTSDASFGSDSSFIGGGTVGGNVTNAGFLSPGNELGQLIVSGNLTLLNTSILLIDLGGKTKGTTYDHLQIGGTATLGGTLMVNVMDNSGVTFTSTDSFTLLSASSVTGTFSNVPNGSTIHTTDGLSSFQLNYTSNGVVLTNFAAIPEPSTWVLLLTGAATLVVWRLRRRS